MGVHPFTIQQAKVLSQSCERPQLVVELELETSAVLACGLANFCHRSRLEIREVFTGLESNAVRAPLRVVPHVRVGDTAELGQNAIRRNLMLDELSFDGSANQLALEEL